MNNIEEAMEELKSFYDNWHLEPDYYGLLSVETKANDLLVAIKNYKLKVDYRLGEMGVSLEYYKEEKSKVKQDEYWEDYDDYDYIVECCLEVLEDADNE